MNTIFVSHAYHTDTRLHNLAQTGFFLASTMFIIYGNVADSHNIVWYVHADRTKTQGDWMGESEKNGAWCKRTHGITGGILMNTNACTSNAIVSLSFVCVWAVRFIEIIACNANTLNGYMIVLFRPIPMWPSKTCDITCKTAHVRTHRHILLFLMNFLPFSARMTKKTKLLKMNQQIHSHSRSVHFCLFLLGSLSIVFEKLDMLTFKLTVFFNIVYMCECASVCARFATLSKSKSILSLRWLLYSCAMAVFFSMLSFVCCCYCPFSAVHFNGKASVFSSTELVSISLFICNKLPPSFAAECVHDRVYICACIVSVSAVERYSFAFHFATSCVNE